MSRISDHRKKEHGGLRNPSATFNGHEVVVNNNGQSEAKKREIVVDWLNSMFTSLSLPKKASDEELRAYLINNPVLHHILNRMSPGSTNEVSDPGSSSVSHSENVKRFLAAMDVLGLPKFKMYDLEKGSMVPVINCLLTLRAQFASSNGKDTFSESPRNASSRQFIYPSFKEERLKVLDPKLRNTFHGSLLSGPRFHDVFQLKQGCYADIPAARISEMMKSTSIDNAPTQSLLSVVNGILDESIEKKNGEIPHRVACLLRKVVQEIERRISTQAQHLKTQNNLFKAREEKYQSRIRVLEALATGTGEETQRAEKTTMEEKSRAEDEDVDIRWMKEKDRYDLEISSLKQELEMAKKTYELQCSKMESKVKDQHNLEISSLKQQLEIVGKTLELQRLQMEAQVRDQYSLEISSLQQELEISKKAYEMKRLQMEVQARNEYDLEVSSLKREAEVAKNKYEMKYSQIETQMKGHNDLEISTLKKELEEAENNAEVKISQMDTQAYDHKIHNDLQVSTLKQESEVERNDNVMKYSQMETRGMDHKDLEISSLKQELEVAKKRYDTKCLEIETRAQDQHSREISSLKRELEEAKKNYNMKCLEFETQGKGQYGHEISSMKQELEVEKHNDEIRRLEMETQVMDGDDPDISSLKLELEGAKKKYEMKCLEIEKQGTGQHSLEISSLKQELEEAKNKYEMKCFETEAQSTDQYGPQISLLKQELEEVKKKYEMKCLETEGQAKDRYSLEISSLKQELEEAKKNYEMKCSELETLVGDRYGVEISSLKQDLEKAKKKYEMKYLEIETQAKDQYNLEISSLKQELEAAKRKYELKCLEIESQAKDQYNLEISSLKQELKAAKSNYAMKCLEIEKQTKDQYNLEISLLKQELETAKKNYEMQCSQVKTQAMGAEAELERKVEELQRSLQDSRNEVGDHKNKVSELERDLEDSIDKVRDHEQKVGELERNLEDSRNEVRDHKEKVIKLESNLRDSKNKVREQDEKVSKLERNLEDARNRAREMEADAAAILYASKTKERIYQGFMDSQYGALKDLRSFGGAIKQEVLRSRSTYSEELNRIGPKLKALARAADDYHLILAENRKLFNEVQDLKGNIRVFCRVRPFLPKQTGRQTIIEHCGDDGELVIVNPSKQAKDGVRSFKFNKVFGPASTQAEVYSETQPFVRSVLDGFNACIFAYGQTGSGKTHTMSGPKGATKEEWGINFRALDDLFTISQNRRNSITYEIGVQMVEIYNEQVRDLLSADGSQKKIGIVTNSQSSGLAVPDATLKNVNSTSDVIVLMDTGLKNRTVSATAMNERSSRSHSIITIHVNGTDVKTGAVLRGSLHLVDLAGSERVDRSEVTGDRLKEAQHINKSLAALGDVIFALSQKSNHVPYRNSKLTQLLQTSLGGQAKTLMFVQVNPDSISYIETLSTLKFAERVSGVELGAARSSKDAKGDPKELIDQVASLKDTISKKDEEIEQLQVLKDLKNGYPSANVEKRVTRS